MQITKVSGMNFTKQELIKLSTYCDVKRNDDERNMRRIRRNFKLLDERFNELPEELAVDGGIESPQEQLNSLSESKAEAVILKKKLKIEISKLK